MVETFDCTNTNLKKGSKGSKVSLLQSYLKEFGYYTTSAGKYLKIDGDFGVYTENAVKSFQRATGHTADGVFGPKTCKSLNDKIIARNNLDIGFNCPNVRLVRGNSNASDNKKLQQMLYTLGYYTGRIDGDFAYYTEESLKDFQRDNGLTQSGILDANTCNILTQRYKSKLNINVIAANTNSSNNLANANKPDTSKQIYTPEEANISIDGLYLIASTIDPGAAFNNSDWKQLELTNNKFFMYKSHAVPRDWTVECYLHKAELKYLFEEFVKMQDRPCIVICEEFTGKFVASVKYARSKGNFKKVTITLTEYLV